MATYNSPLFNDNFPLNTVRTPLDRVLAIRFNRMRARAAIMKALNGVAPGATALSGQKRVQANTTEVGGLRVIENYNIVNRATTAADVTYNNTIFIETSRINTPTNKAGNYPA